MSEQSSRGIIWNSVLGAAFILVITPLGLIVRFWGDPMSRKWRQSMKTYRVGSKTSKGNDLRRPY
jgi:hypothetical protein